MAASMSSAEWAQLAHLASKAAWHEKENSQKQNNYKQLQAVASYAGRMAW